MKQVYQTDNNGIFIGVTYADPDPMEENNWLIPAGCIEHEPPPFTENQVARWDGETWVIENIPIEQEPEPETPTFEEKYNIVKDTIEFTFNNKVKIVTENYPLFERETWYKQELEAKAYDADNNAPVPFLTKLAASKGITVPELANRILAKIDTYENIISVAISTRDQNIKALKECETIEDLQTLEDKI